MNTIANGNDAVDTGHAKDSGNSNSKSNTHYYFV